MKTPIHLPGWSTLAAISSSMLLLAYGNAGEIIAPAAVEAEAGDGPFGGIAANLINQSGMTPNYSSGETDFDTYVATASHPDFSNRDQWVSGFPGLPSLLTFDLGSVQAIDMIALWNSKSSGSPRRFKLYSDDDAEFDGGSPASLIGTFTAVDGTSPLTFAQVFSFAQTATRWVHLNVITTGGGGFINLGEVAFSRAERPVTIVPETAIHRAWEIRWQSQAGSRYIVQASNDMETWEDASDAMAGTGDELFSLQRMTDSRKFYRVVVVE